jgi:lysyl-tRNA synthetase class 2
MNQEVKEVFINRSRIIQAIRDFLNNLDYLEVETPILQPVYGGANARPFMTHHNVLDIPLFLRIANELYLKRLIVGGFDRVYEFAKDFRNEGMDRDHNPEFTMIELYQAYADYRDMMDLTENMILHTVEAVFDKVEIRCQGTLISYALSWKRMTMIDSIHEVAGIDIETKSDRELIDILQELGEDIENNTSRGNLISDLFEVLVEPKLIQPTFIFDYPVEVSPLAKKKRGNEKFVERFELFINGMEIGNAFSELNDPVDQRKRFIEQAKKRELGDEEAFMMDEDYLRALEYGMPPTGGLGIGIDRLTMLLTDQGSIRDVILFPQMRPER